MDKAPSFRTGPDPGLVFRPVKRQPLTDAGRIARKAFYNSANWKRCRALKLKRDPMCVACAKEGRHVPAFHVHHRVDLADAPDLRLVLSNLEGLCHSCHSRETIKRMREERKAD